MSEGELARARAILGSPLWNFFLELPRNDQRHGLDVLATVDRIRPDAPPILQQAALLHDMGKVGARFSVVERSLTVLLSAVTPGSLTRVLRARPDFARRHAIYADHARIGAERLRAVGAFDLAGVVAEHHESKPEREVTSWLQQADHLN